MAQRKALTESEKGCILMWKRQGISLAQMAQWLNCSCITVRKWWRRQRDHQPARPRGRPKRGILSSYPEALRSLAIQLKEEHPHWGPAMIHLEIRSRAEWKDQALPSEARLTALFKQACPNAVRSHSRRAYPEQPPKRVGRPHVRWQMDAKEGVRIGHDYATILDIRDPAGALMIASCAFLVTTVKRWRKLALRETQNVLRQAFILWGMPLELQTDREVVYTGSADHNFPSPFTLWLVGLGIHHVVGRSYRPTDQSQVERNHRTLADFAWKDQGFDALEQLQQALDKARERYNSAFPVEAAACHGQPPLVVHPWAIHSGRHFHPALEHEYFNMAGVDEFLAEFVWVRQVTATGVAVFGDHRYYVGRAYRGQQVTGQFLPASRSIAFKAKDGTFIKELPLVNCTKEDLLGCVPEAKLMIGYQFSLPLHGV
jgi:hypothetical protein